MKERPTPETDAAQMQAEHNCNILRPSGWGFARQMERERDKAREALQRIADCDWVITLPDRMDAVRKIARDALEGRKMNEQETPETDQQDVIYPKQNGKPWVRLEFARKLERERNAARAQIKGWELKWECAVEMAALAQLKLDNVKEAAK